MYLAHKKKEKIQHDRRNSLSFSLLLLYEKNRALECDIQLACIANA